MGDDREDRVRRILTDAKPAPEGKKRRPVTVVNVAFGRGDGNVVGNHNQVKVIKTEKIVNRTIIDPTAGDLTPHQKQRLQALVDGIVKVGGQTHGAVWKRFQRYFSVNTYHALPADRYEDAKRYLRMLYGRAKKGEI